MVCKVSQEYDYVRNKDIPYANWSCEDDVAGRMLETIDLSGERMKLML